MSLNPEYLKIGHDIIGAAYAVRNAVNRGLRESYYEAALAWELARLGYCVERQVIVPAIYKGEVIDDAYKADIIVDNRVIIEVKAVGQMKEAEPRQLLTYLVLSNFALGYLINFGVEHFSIGRLSEPLPYKSGIYRMVNGI